jgi:decaprenyl-phosphate phosphoribosyltransferase
VATTAGVKRGSIRAVVRLLRPRQWVKNAFVLAPLIFSGEFRDTAAVVKALLATALFCVASSATYVFNDILDREADARHPIKSRTRPIAAGEVSVNAAIVLFGLLISIVVASVAWSPATTAVVGTYTCLNLAYTIKLKHVPVVDIFVLAAGFVLRVFAGAVVLDVPLSSWMMVTTLSLALYLAAVKRRDELTSSGGSARAVLNSYSVPLLDRYAMMAALCAVIFYGLFVVTVKPKLNVTLPFVLFGLFRYWYVVENEGHGESPTDAVWSDWPLILTVIAWAAVCVWRLKAI